MLNCIRIADGIGNIIQAIPFIKEIKKQNKTLLSINDVDFLESYNLVSHFFDKVVSNKKTYYNSPPLEKYTHTPEYKSWFLFYRIKEPTKYEINKEDVSYKEFTGKHDFILWGGCKPKWKTKQWPYWPNLAELLLSKNFSVGVVGLPNEGEVFSDKVTDYRGKISLLETGGIINNSQFFIGNEGGLTHYANALQKTMWVVWGGTSVTKNMPPPRKNYHVISLNLPCQPCQFRLNGPRGCGDYKCLYNLSAETVLQKITEKI